MIVLMYQKHMKLTAQKRCRNYFAAFVASEWAALCCNVTNTQKKKCISKSRQMRMGPLVARQQEKKKKKNDHLLASKRLKGLNKLSIVRFYHTVAPVFAEALKDICGSLLWGMIGIWHQIYFFAHVQMKIPEVQKYGHLWAQRECSPFPLTLKSLQLCHVSGVLC